MDNEIKKHAEVVSVHMNNQAKDISRFIQQANEQEFIICRFFISWGIGTVAAVAGIYLYNFNINSPIIPYLSFLRWALFPLVISIATGTCYHLHFHDKLLKKADELDESNRNYMKRTIEKGPEEIINISKEIIQQYSEKPSISFGSKKWLYWQMGLFGLGIIIIGISLFLVKL